MPFSLSVKGIDEAAAAIDNMAKTIKPQVTQQLNTIFDQANAQMYRDCPVKTGYLRSTIKKQSGSGNKLAEITVSAPYAGIVNFGYGNRTPKPFATNGYNYILSQLKTLRISSK